MYDIPRDRWSGVAVKRYRYRAYPDGDEKRALSKVFGCVRVVFNDVIAVRQASYLAGEPYPTAGELSKRLLTAAKIGRAHV